MKCCAGVGLLGAGFFGNSRLSDTARLAAYTAEHGLSRNDLFWAVAQALVEQAEPQSKERSLLEALVAWGRGQVGQNGQLALWNA